MSEIIRGKTAGASAVFACGAALFSDGYQNGIVGLANFVLKKIHPVEMARSQRGVLFSSMGFFGITFGMLFAGIYIDKFGGRKNMMFMATVVVAVFAAMLALAWAPDVNVQLSLMIFYRFMIGTGIGAEYPAGSVSAAENTEDPNAPIAKGRQQMYFALATNAAIDWGFVVSAIVPLALYGIFGMERLEWVWRLSFAVGILPPLIVMYFRSNVAESYRFQTEAMKNVSIPWGLVMKKYWKPFLGIALSWCIYDFIAYPFGIYSDTIFDSILGDDNGLAPTLGYNVIANFFYIPGTIGALVLDRIKPKKSMVIFLVVQGIVGFLMSGLYSQLSNIIPLFAVMYGLFLSFGEAGPGNCLGLLATKSFPTAVRGQLYAACAIIGKLGALAGTWSFPLIIASFPGSNQAAGPFFIGSGLAIFSAFIVYFLVNEIDADSLALEDAAFREYLELHGYDTSVMGLQRPADLENVTTLAITESTEKSVEESDEK